MSCALDGTVVAWDVHRRRVVAQDRHTAPPGLVANPPLAHCVAVARDGQHVAVALGDGTVALAAWRRLRRVAVRAGHAAATAAVCFLRGSDRVVSGSVDESVVLWSTRGSPVHRWEHLGKVNWVAAHPARDVFFVASSDAAVHMVTLRH